MATNKKQEEIMTINKMQDGINIVEFYTAQVLALTRATAEKFAEQTDSDALELEEIFLRSLAINCQQQNAVLKHMIAGKARLKNKQLRDEGVI